MADIEAIKTVAEAVLGVVGVRGAWGVASSTADQANEEDKKGRGGNNDDGGGKKGKK